jgi:hypothetical protein
MIYLFCGSDTEKVRAKAFAWVAAARTKEPNLAYTRLSREEISTQTLEHAVSSGGLFITRTLTLLDDPFPARQVSRDDEDGEEPNNASVIEDSLELLSNSDNAIVILAPKLLVVKAKKISAKAKMTYRFDRPIQPPVRGFNLPLANALTNRNQKNLWLEIMRSLRAGDPPEMLHGVLHWKARDLLGKNNHLWEPNEVRLLSLNLIRLLQDSRRKGLDLATELERFALRIEKEKATQITR